MHDYYKDGGNVGACALARYYAAGELDVVLLSNATHGGLAVIRELDRQVRAQAHARW